MRLEPRAAPPFLIVFFVLVNYVLLNLVIATVLEKLELRDDEKQARQRAEILRHTAQRELSDGAYIDALETARCWFALAARASGGAGDAPHNSPRGWKSDKRGANGSSDASRRSATPRARRHTRPRVAIAGTGSPDARPGDVPAR